MTKTRDTSSGARLRIPGFVTVTEHSPPGTADPEYVLSNEATGKYFMANQATVRFVTALRARRPVPEAMASAGIAPDQVGALVQRLLDSGLAVQPGATQTPDQKPKAPIEGALISARWDMADAGGLARRFSAVGRFAYSRLGAAIWLLAMLVMLFQLLTHRDKAALTLRQVLDADLRQWLVLTLLFLGLKALHELGHILAYREMCRQERLDPGPIRVGISVFAFTPFPFTDVTGAWRLRDRWRRVVIGAGGIYFETWAMAVLTLIWAQTQSGLFQTVAFQVAVFSGAMALLFNLNPAIKLDGYFILTDYLRAPNLAQRASQAARSTLARLLGAALPRPSRAELGYWLLAYGYRWTVFAGVFWLLYQFDPRLSPLAAGIVVMTLIIRPMMQTLRFLRRVETRPARGWALMGGLAALVALAFVPLPARLLVPGQVLTFDTRFVEPTEEGWLAEDATGGLHLRNPALDQQITDTELKGALLENLRRASYASAQEQAGLGAELTANAETLHQLRARRALLDLTPAGAQAAVWTPLDARWLRAAWVSQSARWRLGALSEPTAPHLRLRLDAALLTRDFPLTTGAELQARLVSTPRCMLSVRLETDPRTAIAPGGTLPLVAAIDGQSADCTGKTAHGAAVVARLPMPPQSLTQRLWLGGARLLQDRLQLDSSLR